MKNDMCVREVRHTFFQAILFDFKPQPTDRRMWQARLLILPFFLMCVGHIYLIYFFDPLMQLFAYMLHTSIDGAAAHVLHRQHSVSLVLGLFAVCLIFNRLYLVSLTLTLFVIGSGQFYDYWHRFMLDRTLMSGLQNYQIDYLFMIGNVGNSIRAAFFATVAYSVWATWKKNMELLAAPPR